ncbi:unnamed protein product, partial [Prorocentrum cordatum]
MDGADVVRGPKTPFWGCQSCGLTSNWACRLRCRCGAKAPAFALQRAKSFGGGGSPPRLEPGRGRPPAAGSRREAKLESKLAELQKKLDQVIGGATKAARAPATGQGPGQHGGTQSNGGGGDGQDPLQARVLELEGAIKACGKSDDTIEARTLLETKLKAVRSEIESKKPSITQHTNVGHRLARATTKMEKVTTELEEHIKLLDELNVKTDETRARKIAAEAEVAELQRQHVQSLPGQASDMGDKRPVDFPLPPEALEGKDAIKSMLETAEFKEFVKLFAVHRAASGPDADAESNVDDGEQVPTPHDEEMDDAFQDEAAAEAFWEKHRGDKRAFTQALLGAQLKKPKTVTCDEKWLNLQTYMDLKAVWYLLDVLQYGQGIKFSEDDEERVARHKAVPEHV